MRSNHIFANTPHASGPRELVLIGGGHTHALLLRKLGKKPLADVRLTVISDVEHAAYSGMLPGHISGFYRQTEIQIDLRRLCHFAGAGFIHAKVSGLDLKRKQVLLADDSAPVSVDLVSINIGGTPHMNDVAGAEQWAIPAKPVQHLLSGWERAKAATQNSANPLQIILVGGGAGGVELALAMHSQLRSNAKIVIVHGEKHLLPGHNICVQHIFSKLLQERKLTVIPDATVVEVMPTSVRLKDGRSLAADFVFWVTQVAPPRWLTECGLDTTPEGFIRVKPTLQTINYPWIFAAGDVAAIECQKLPKSGVYAVRMANPLGDNLRAHLSGRLLGDYKPQRHTLSLIGTADRRAVASYCYLAGHSRLFWWWKDWIDRRFMRQFRQLPA
ncbi:selenide, water dikinase [Nitrosospira sp. Nl5]|uniref:FAD-dependent oxidoreductase n=1 Tax=Nitrosospira sp. Nl5 TaxID=200120 RepID=UPI00088B42A0|nr:FAD-dependent oxidoreductase [Nitrosospira sp. Nl5]SCY43943.1 selenide, water dikinase [Nitrosospira sp. Nl5]